MEWIKIENQLPPKNTLVLVKRIPNKADDKPIYIAMRQEKQLSINIDPSQDCYWWGLDRSKFTSENEHYFTLDGFSNFSDATVVEWSLLGNLFNQVNY